MEWYWLVLICVGLAVGFGLGALFSYFRVADKIFRGWR